MEKIKCRLFHSNWEGDLWSEYSTNIGIGVSSSSTDLRVEQRLLSNFHREIKSAWRKI